MFDRTGLVPPYSGTGDGNASQPETITDLLREEAVNTRAGCLEDAIRYLVENEMNGSGIDVKRAINIRWNISWETCDAVILAAKPLAQHEIKKIKAERARIEQEQARFDNLSGQFAALGLQIQKSGDKYDLSLSESQLQLCASVLEGAAHEGKP